MAKSAGPKSRTAKARALGINHVVLEVGDVAEGLAFYARIFAFTLRSRSEHSAFIDMGDQFLVLTEPRTQAADSERHFGFVVDDRDAARAALEELGVTPLPGGGLDFLDPWGNHVQVVDYRNVTFTKSPGVLRALGLDGLEKRDTAKQEIAERGMAPE